MKNRVLRGRWEALSETYAGQAEKEVWMFRKRLAHIALFGCIALLIGGCCEPGPSESLAVTLHPQGMSNWCWAASGQMAMDYLGHDVAQCVQVNNRTGRTDCCNTPTPGVCNVTGWPEFAKYDFGFDRTNDAALGWDTLKRQISTNSYCGKKPFCFTWHWIGNGGHMMIAIGYRTVDGVNQVEMYDPLPPNVGDHQFITYDAYVSAPGYTHWDDFYNLKYEGGD